MRGSIGWFLWKGGRRMSLSQRGAGLQFLVGMTLVSVIPVLVLLAFLFPGPVQRSLRGANVLVLGLAVVALVSLGYAILIKYPVNTIRLRRYLAQLARDELPEDIELVTGEEDLSSIEDYMRRIVHMAAERIRLIEEQSSQLVEAERQRVMIESLGAACHHLGQPATVITAYLSLMEKGELPPETHEMVVHCREAAQSISDILCRLPRVAQYRTEPYLVREGIPATVEQQHILQIQ